MPLIKLQSEGLNLADNFAFTGTITGAGGNMTPSFRAEVSSSQNVTDATATVINFDTETFDNGSCYFLCFVSCRSP